MPDSVRGFEYDVALSFAAEDRSVAESIATELKAAGVRVFFDAWETANLWGKDLYQHLDEVYTKKARFCVILISASYARKAWTNHELRSAQARALREHEEYILPVRLDDTELPGVRETVAFLDLRTISAEQLAELLLRKIRGDVPPQGEHQQPQTQRRPNFTIPRLQRAGTDPVEDSHKLIEYVERVFDERVQVLRDAGLAVRKDTGPNGLRHYRVTHSGRLVYFLRMKVGGPLGPTTVSFLDGWNEPTHDDAATAVGQVRRMLNENEPSVRLTNFSLLDAGPVTVSLSFQALSDGIWEKACKIIESLVNRNW